MFDGKEKASIFALAKQRERCCREGARLLSEVL